MGEKKWVKIWIKKSGYKKWGCRLKRIKITSILKFLPKHHYYRPLKKLTKSPIVQTSKKSMKKNCAKFFDKNKNFIFFRVFHRKCLKTSSKGTKTNQVKILSSFWHICEKDVFFDEKKTDHPIPSHPIIRQYKLAGTPGTPEGHMGKTTTSQE